MKNTEIPLDIIFLNDDLEVVSIQKGVPNSEDFITAIATYVLEVNQDSSIKEGDTLEFTSKKTKSDSKMLVLNSDGDTQMILEGGERIFSRPHTKTLIKFAKKAAALDTPTAYAALGKRLFKFLEIQENTEPEFVKSK
jgi:hypothetical protein